MELLEKHFDTAFDAPDGIKKLRELILTLAIQGKLVPQNTDDQPASVLLKEVKAEKIRLLKEKDLKTEANEQIKEDDEYIGRPIGWEYCRLGNLAKFIDYRGKTPKKVESGIPLITAKNVRFGYINRQPCEYVTQEEYKSWMTRGFPKLGDLLFTTEAPLGNIAIVDIEEPFALAQRVICFQLHNPDMACFLKWLFMSPLFQLQLLNNSTGMTATGIKASKLKEIPIPVPPLSEQRRIVAKIDELMARCDEMERLRSEQKQKLNLVHTAAINSLMTSKDADSFADSWSFITRNFDDLYSVRENVAELRKTILQLAVMGKLVPQDPNDQPASELLKEIEAEKKRLVKEGKIKEPKPLPPIKPEELLYDLPKGWEWIRLGKIAEIIGGYAYKSSLFRKSGNHQVLRLGNIRPDIIRIDENPVYIDDNLGAQTESFRLIKNDIIITMTGTRAKRDYLYTVRVESNPLNGKTLYVNQRVGAIRPFLSSIYLDKALKVQTLQDVIFSAATGSANQANIGISSLQEWIIPFPPLPEQHRIVAKINQLMVLCDELEKQIDSATNKKTALLNAMVAAL